MSQALRRTATCNDRAHSFPVRWFDYREREMSLWYRNVLVTSILTCFFCLQPSVRAQTRWNLDSDGGITWNIQPGKAHQDHIEMSGKRVSVIVTYGVDEKGQLILRRQLVFPLL